MEREDKREKSQHRDSVTMQGDLIGRPMGYKQSNERAMDGRGRSGIGNRLGQRRAGGSWEVAGRSRPWLLSLEMVPWGQRDKAGRADGALVLGHSHPVGADAISDLVDLLERAELTWGQYLCFGPVKCEMPI